MDDAEAAEDRDAPDRDTPDDDATDQPAADPDAADDDSIVEVYWRPGCIFCAALRRGLRRRGIPVEEHNIWKEPDAAQFVRSVAGGNETVPTVVVGGHWMVNPSAGRVERMAAEVAPGVLERAAEQRDQRPSRLGRLFSRRS